MTEAEIVWKGEPLYKTVTIVLTMDKIRVSLIVINNTSDIHILLSGAIGIYIGGLYSPVIVCRVIR